MRDGSLLRFPNYGQVVMTGDLHGQRRNFNRIRKIAALGDNPRRHLILQEACHGGLSYPNGGVSVAAYYDPPAGYDYQWSGN